MSVGLGGLFPSSSASASREEEERSRACGATYKGRGSSRTWSLDHQSSPKGAAVARRTVTAVTTPRRRGTTTKWAGMCRVNKSGAPPSERGVQRMDRLATTSSSTAEPATASPGEASHTTVSPGAANAGATRPSKSKPATIAPTVCTQPEPLACATPAHTNSSNAVLAIGTESALGERQVARFDRFGRRSQGLLASLEMRARAPSHHGLGAGTRSRTACTAARPTSNAPTGAASVTRRCASTLGATAFTSPGRT